MNKFDSFVKKLSTDYPDLTFISGKNEHWSPKSKTITYIPDRSWEEFSFGLLHELSHALLGHQDYKTDFELLKLEGEAWELAAKLGKKYGVKISDDYIQNCLDTYRDWLHKRSGCPKCGMRSLQKDNDTYKCFNCGTAWKVSSKRFSRSYRLSSK